MFVHMGMFALFSVFLLCSCIAVHYTRKLTFAATVTAAIMATLLFIASGPDSVILLALFFISGVLATAWKREWKENNGLVKKEEGKRNTGQVLANGGMMTLIGLMLIVTPSALQTGLVLMACCVSSATADTVSSETGMVYGSKHFNILNFRKDVRGADGVISIEGTLAGIAGSSVIALAYVLLTQWNFNAFAIIVTSGTIGNIADSLMGALLERRHIIGNNTVNFLNTLVAAVSGYLLLHLPG